MKNLLWHNTKFYAIRIIAFKAEIMSVTLFAREESAWLYGHLYLYCALKNQTNQKATDDHSSLTGHWGN